MTIRLGLVRPDRPSEVVARADARVIEYELGRRLGAISIDFRIDGPTLGPWRPREHAAWPVDIDHRIDASRLWAPGLPPLAALLSRTVDPIAADVRRRMLTHLGLLTGDGPVEPQRPIDAWLTAEATNGRLFSEFASGDGAGARLDTVFDSIVADIDHDSTPTIARLTTERDAALSAAQEAADDRARTERETVERLEALQAEITVLRERISRDDVSDAAGS